MADQVTIIVTPTDTNAGSFNIYQYVYDINGDPSPNPFLIESNVPLSSLISPGHTVTIDDLAFKIVLVSNDDRGLGCADQITIEHSFSNIRVYNNFQPPVIGVEPINITAASFGGTNLIPLPDGDIVQNVYYHLPIETTTGDTTSVTITNADISTPLSYILTVRDSSSVSFTNSDTLLGGTDSTINFTGTTLSPDRQFLIQLDPGIVPTRSVTPSRTQYVTPTRTPSITPTITISRTPNQTRSVTRTVTSTPIPSTSISRTPTVTPTRTLSRTVTITPILSLSVSTTPSVTPTLTVTKTPTKTPTITPSRTPSISISVTPSVTPTRIVSKTPSKTPSRTPTRTVTPSKQPMPVVITNMDGAYAIIAVSINGVSVTDVSYPVTSGVQVVGSTLQLVVGVNVVVTLSNVSYGERITVTPGQYCINTIFQDYLVFNNIDTRNGVTISYRSGSC